MATQQPDGLETVGAERASDRLSRRGRLSFHLVCFLIGSWNLFAVNASHSLQQMWFWPWVAGWAVVLIIHLVLALALPPTSMVKLLGNPASSEA